MGLHDYGDDYVLDLVLESDTWYVALLTAQASDTQDGTELPEVSGGGYARQSIAPADWATSSGGTKRNAVAIEFPDATADYASQVTHFALVDASDNVLVSGPLSEPRRIKDTYTPYVPVDGLAVKARSVIS